MQTSINGNNRVYMKELTFNSTDIFTENIRID